MSTTPTTPELVPHPEELRTDTPEPAETLCRDLFDDVWARGNADDAGRYLAPGFTYNPMPGYEADRAGYKRMVRDVHKAFPDLYADIVDIVASGDKVAARWIMEGTHEAAWMGIPPTGRRVRAEGVTFATVQDGRVVREFTAQNDLEVLGRLGVTDLAPILQAVPP